MSLRDAAQQALEALEEYQAKGAPFWACDAAVAALRAALAEPTVPSDCADSHQPVAWRFRMAEVLPWSFSDDGYYVSCKKDIRYIVEPLYTNPPQRQPLSDEQIEAAAKSAPAAVYELMHGHEITVRQFRAALAEFARAIEKANGIGGDK